ncbi:MAG: trypsin-like peptidase domain-containing protein, partial [Armatimonadota bacterium]|nr:trypsin-like peptidase domain-containing protein [Armatimonadota bacterium]
MRRRVWAFCLVLAAVLGLLPATGATQGVAELVERVRPAVAIVVARREGSLGQGSGFVYDGRGFLLTAAHVVEGAREVIVRLPNRRPMVAVVAQVSQSLDVAALRVGEEGLPTIPLAPGQPRVGEEILVLGYPRAETIGFDDLTVTRGIVSRLLVDQGLLQFDASVNPGNSGGPVVNSRGEAVGIVVGRVRGAAGINFAVTSEAARDVARLALQVPFAPTQPPAVQTPAPALPTTAPAPAAPPGPGEWRLIGSKGPTPRNT